MRTGDLLAKTCLCLSIIFLTTCDAPLQDKSRSDFQRIDLTLENWTVQQKGKPGTIQNPAFPILFNDLFDNGVQDRPIEYEMQTRFKLPAQLPDHDLVLRLGHIGENWSVYLNDQLLRNEIYLSRNGQLAKRRSMTHVIIPLPEDVIQPGTNKLTIKVLGYTQAVPFVGYNHTGLRRKEGYFIDAARNTPDAISSNLFALMAVAIYFFFGAYHLILFLARRRTWHYLYFGLFAILVATYILVLQPYFQHLFPASDSELITRIEYAALFLQPAAFILFLYYFFNNDSSLTKTLWLVIGWSVLCCLLSIFIPNTPPYTSVVLYFWQLSMPLLILYSLYLVISMIIKGNHEALPLLLALVWLAFIAIFDIVQSRVNFTDVRLLQFGFFLFILFLVFRIARHMARIENQLENIAEDLREMNTAFFRFVPTQVLNELGTHSAAELEVGDSVERRMSVLFTDIRSFTSLAESLTSNESFQFLNSYLKRMEPQIQTYGGYVDKFLGDGIMALFSEDHNSTLGTGERSLRAALKMQEELITYNRHREHDGYRPIRTGTGIHTGNLSLGTIGSSNRIETTVLGNTVNVAARLEELTSYLRLRLIVSGETFRELDNPEEWHYRELGSILPRGKTEGITIYEFFDGDKPEIVAKKMETREDLASGIAFYRAGQFDEALTYFKKVLRVYNEDRVARLYYKLAKTYANRELGENWIGTIEIVQK